MRRANRSQRRAGNVLLLCALMIFVIFAMAALVIDLGLARSTQRHMQTAADSAAREGLRYRDYLPDDAATTDLEVARRSAANQMAQANLGTTPIVTFSGGIDLPGTTFKAGETMALGSFTVDLKPNLTNDPAGDMASGTIDASSDFVAGGGSDAFQVKLRRISDPIDPDSQTSSSGPPSPILFGRATLLSPNYQAQGISLRATSVVQARPVFAVGKYSPAGITLPAAASFAIEFDQWFKLPDNVPITIDGKTAKYFNKTDSGTNPGTTSGILMIGNTLAPTTATPSIGPKDVYIPLFRTVGKIDLVVAFGFVSETDGSPKKSHMASENATASLSPYVRPPNLDPADLSIPNLGDPNTRTLLTALMKDPRKGQLLQAPVLVR